MEAINLNTKIFLLAIALVLAPFAAAASTLYGSVADQNTLAPIAGATISVYDSTTGALIGQNATDALGAYNVTFPDQDANISVTAPNYYPDNSMTDVPFASNPGLSIEVNFSLAAAPVGHIVGVVTDAATSAAIANADVQAIQNSIIKGQTNTSAAGAYILDLPAGTYSLKFSANNYINATWTPIIVNVNATTTRNIALTPLAAISGNVTNTFGEAVANATVAVGATSALTDASGHYAIANVNPGIYLLNVTAAQHSAFTQSNYLVAAGANVKNVVLTPTFGRLIGNINNATGIMTVTLNGSAVASTNNSSYSISNVAAGSYVAAATTTTPGFSANPATVVIGAGATAHQDFTFNPVVTTGSIQGFVTDAGTGAVLAGVSVNYGGASVATDANGSYLVSGLGQGAYVLNAGGASYTCAPANAAVNVFAGMQSHQNFSCTAVATPTPTPNNGNGNSGTSGTRIYPTVTPVPTSTPQATVEPTTAPTETPLVKKTLAYSAKKWALKIVQGNESITLFLSREYTLSADPSSPSGYTSIITLTVINPSNTTLKNFKLSELIPSVMADDPNFTYSVKPTAYSNYQAEWRVDSLGAGKQFSIYYGVPKKLQDDFLRLYANPPMLQMLETGAQPAEISEVPVDQTQPGAQTGLFTASNLPLLGLAVVFFVVVIAVILVITREAKHGIEGGAEDIAVEAEENEAYYDDKPKARKAKRVKARKGKRK